MPVVNMAHLYEFKVCGLIKGDQNCFFTQYFKLESDPDPAEETTVELLNFLRSYWRTEIMALLPPSYTVWRYELRGIKGNKAVTNGLPALYDLGTVDTVEGVVGTDEGGLDTYPDILPAHDVVIVTARNSEPGRGSRVNWRMGPVYALAAQDGMLNDSNDGLTNWLAIADAIIDPKPFAGPSTTVAVPVKFHKRDFFLAGSLTLPLTWTTEFSSVGVNPRIRHLDSRRGPVRGGF